MQAPRSSQDQSFVVTVIPAEPTPTRTIGDVIVGSMGVAGSLLLLALVLGAVVAGVRVLWNRWHPAVDDHLPPVTPSTPLDSSPPSSQAR